MSGIRKKAAAVLLALAVAVLISGCGLSSGDEEPETETETETETEFFTESETESETEFQTNVVYISEDKTIRIILPDSTWKVTQDLDEMRVFSSGSEAMINIVHADSADSMKNITVMKSKEELEESLKKQYPEDDAFEILSFETRSSSKVSVYEYIVKYNYSTSMWAYSATYALLSMSQDAAYVVTGTVTEDDTDLLNSVTDAVESFTVVNDSVFSVLPGTVENNNETEAEIKEENAGSAEMNTLTEYAAGVVLYASSDVNIRRQPSTEAEKIGYLNAGDSVTVTAETANWFRVSVNSQVGYISKAYLTYTQPVTEISSSSSGDDNEVAESTRTAAELMSEISYDTAYTYYTTAGVNLRSLPGTDSSIISSLGSGTQVIVTGETDNWFAVSAGGVTGYISKAYMSVSKPSVSAENTEQADNTSSDSSNNSASTTGTVSGTITAVTSDTLLIQGEDGVTYSINYAQAQADTSGLAEGVYISAVIDYSKNTAEGALYASSISY